MGIKEERLAVLKSWVCAGGLGADESARVCWWEEKEKKKKRDDGGEVTSEEGNLFIMSLEHIHQCLIFGQSSDIRQCSGSADDGFIHG